MYWKSAHLERMQQVELQLEPDRITRQNRHAKALGDCSLECAVAGHLHRRMRINAVLAKNLLGRLASPRAGLAQQQRAVQQVCRLEGLACDERMSRSAVAHEIVGH